MEKFNLHNMCDALQHGMGSSLCVWFLSNRLNYMDVINFFHPQLVSQFGSFASCSNCESFLQQDNVISMYP